MILKNQIKRLQKQIWNSKGSALIMVIICMLLIGIITSVVIVTASTNLSNVMLYKKSSENFYSAEHVLDRLKSALEELADESVRVAYQSWLTEYSYNSSTEQHEKFQKLFVKDYKERLKNYLNITDEVTPEGVTPAAITPTELSTIVSVPAIVAGFDPSKVRFKEAPTFKPSSDTEIILNVQIIYTEDDGTESTIDTDLKFSINPEDFKITTSGGANHEIADYAVITDGAFTNTGSECGGNTLIVQGNVYGGGSGTGVGLDFANTVGASVTFYSDKIITRNTLKVRNGAEVYIYGKNGPDSYGNLWAKNILFDKSINDKWTSIEAKGSIFLADDLTLNGNNTRFKLNGAKSQFNGYGASEQNVEDSSAIVINSRNAEVDLSEPDPVEGGKISIAGKSFISIPVKFGSSEVTGTTLQGESLSYKGEQAAYLLPSECIIGTGDNKLGHNPLTEEEFSKLTDPSGNHIYTVEEYNTSSPGSITAYIDISKSALNGGVNLVDYVHPGVPAKSFFVKYDDSTKMAYIYLNFRNSDCATAYFNKYYELYPDTVKSRLEKSFGGDIKINPAALETVGNTTVSGSSVVVGPTKKSSDATLITQQWNYSVKFDGLTNHLNETKIGQGSQAYLTNDVAVFNPSWTNLVIDDDDDGDLIKDNVARIAFKRNDKMLRLYTGNEVRLKVDAAGIIVANGDVYIEAGKKFTGLIIAKGNVKVTNGGTLIADPSYIDYFLNNIEHFDDTLYPILNVANATTGTGSGGNIIASDIIKIEYENWKKN